MKARWYDHAVPCSALIWFWLQGWSPIVAALMIMAALMMGAVGAVAAYSWRTGK